MTAEAPWEPIEFPFTYLTTQKRLPRFICEHRDHVLRGLANVPASVRRASFIRPRSLCTPHYAEERTSPPILRWEVL